MDIILLSCNHSMPVPGYKDINYPEHYAVSEAHDRMGLASYAWKSSTTYPVEQQCPLVNRTLLTPEKS